MAELSELFFGAYEHSVDSKGRIIIPVPFRQGLGEKFVVGVTLTFDAIALYPEKVFLEKLELLEKLGRGTDRTKAAAMAQFARSSYPESTMDAQGRLLLPQKLRQRFLGEEKDIEISGDSRVIRIVTLLKAREEEKYFDEHKDEISDYLSELQLGEER